MDSNRYSFRSNFMSIEYTYTILSVDEQARCMEVVYSAEGHQTMHIGARLPYEGEELEAVVAMYAPVAYWVEQKLKVVPPVVGTSGVIVPLAPPVEPEVVAQPVVEGAQTL
jgi:hypothetical protein